ncbi:MAG TPA: ATP-binding protein [Terracidiphilus sp.]|nr:ATP-binding protein [Terracidiphilus sp.]
MPAHLRRAANWLGASLAVGLTAAILDFLGARATTAGMVFLVLVVWMATQAGVILSFYTALLCAVCFDFFFLPPVHTLTLAGPQEWVAMFTFVAGSYVAGRVAERARRQAETAERRREDVERLYTLSKEMLLYEDAAGLMNELPRMIQRIFSLEAVMLYVREQDQFFSSTSDLPMSIQASLSSMAQGQHPTQSVPGEITAMPLMQGIRPVGALGWRSTTLTREVAAAIGAQVAIALARALAIEASARLEALREGERLRSALIDSLTHELRTPLTSIRAAATTLTQGQGLDEASRQDLAAIVDEESARLDALIGEAVEMAELDAHVVKVHAVPQHTRELLTHAIERSQAALEHHNVVVTVEEPDTAAWLDPQLLGRVLRHLLENAARYCPPGTRIALRSRHEADRLVFEVEDNGPGIDPVDLPLIFEKFYRGKKSVGKGKGTGMGLAISRAIMTAHGGGIDFTSILGQGSTFRFWVPLVERQPRNLPESA